MLSENMRILADLFSEQMTKNLEEINKRDPNMVFAIGYTLGTILKEIDELKARGR